MKTFVIGDIHGGLKALKQVLNQAVVTPQDKLIFIGDYVDGWSESAQTISFLLNLSETHRCIFLRGNHEELLYNHLKKKEGTEMWLRHGGLATVKSYAQFTSEEIDRHILFLENMKDFHIDEANRCFVHAGFTNTKGPVFEYFPNYVSWDRTLWETACSLDINISKESLIYPERLKLFSEIYIGHTPTTRIGKNTPTNFANVWNVDTGAAFKGKLSIMDIDSKEFWQSDPVWEHYPDEKGRN
ncbi:MAG: serine/threonine protein phosphatase 1 [Candidatus Latescibacterota bacterium]|jgi:serine/threonine protein phosphatase 1